MVAACRSHDLFSPASAPADNSWNWLVQKKKESDVALYYDSIYICSSSFLFIFPLPLRKPLALSVSNKEVSLLNSSWTNSKKKSRRVIEMRALSSLTIRVIECCYTTHSLYVYIEVSVVLCWSKFKRIDKKRLSFVRAMLSQLSVFTDSQLAPIFFFSNHPLSSGTGCCFFSQNTYAHSTYVMFTSFS